MVNQQKGVQQETAYSAVVVNDHMYPRPGLYHFFMFLLYRVDPPLLVYAREKGLAKGS